MISTTNRATDAVAVSIGRAVLESQPATTADPDMLDGLCRIGRGGALQTFREAGLESMLRGVDPQQQQRLDALAQRADDTPDPDEKAQLRQQMAQVRAGGTDRSGGLFRDPDLRVVVCTAAAAMNLLARDATLKTSKTATRPSPPSSSTRRA